MVEERVAVGREVVEKEAEGSAEAATGVARVVVEREVAERAVARVEGSEAAAMVAAGQAAAMEAVTEAEATAEAMAARRSYRPHSSALHELRVGFRDKHRR